MSHLDLHSITFPWSILESEARTTRAIKKSETMRVVKNITVAVSPELYRKTRMLAVEYDTTVTTLVTYLLEEMPRALQFARYPAPGAQSASSSRKPQSALKTPAPAQPSTTQAGAGRNKDGVSAVKAALTIAESIACGKKT
jgi:hypothetical protein